MTVDELVAKLNEGIMTLGHDLIFLEDDLEETELDGDLADADDIAWIRHKIDQDKEMIKEHEIALKVINQIIGFKNYRC